MNIESIAPAILNSLVDNRVYWDTTPNDLVTGSDGYYASFFILSDAATSRTQYIDQTIAGKVFTRLQIVACASDPISRGELAAAAIQAFVDSGYTIRVYEGSIGGFDDSRQLYSNTQYIGIWYDP